MMTRGSYIQLVADLLNREPHQKTRESRVREANRELYRACVSKKGTNVQADLALAQAAQREQS